MVSGYGNGTFGPNDSITREQMATMLWRYAQKEGYARTNNTQRKKLARLVEQNFFEAMKEENRDPNTNQTEKIIGLLKEKPEMTENLLNLLSMMVS